MKTKMKVTTFIDTELSELLTRGKSGQGGKCGLGKALELVQLITYMSVTGHTPVVGASPPEDMLSITGHVEDTLAAITKSTRIEVSLRLLPTHKAPFLRAAIRMEVKFFQAAQEVIWDFLIDFCFWDGTAIREMWSDSRHLS